MTIRLRHGLRHARRASASAAVARGPSQSSRSRKLMKPGGVTSGAAQKSATSSCATTSAASSSGLRPEPLGQAHRGVALVVEPAVAAGLADERVGGRRLVSRRGGDGGRDAGGELG